MGKKLKKILVTGGKGQLGEALSSLNGEKYEIICMGKKEIDINSYEDVRKAIESIKPIALINCAAFTDVDGCEENPRKAFQINFSGILNLISICHSKGIKLVQISTDYVFNGMKSSPYLESELPDPLNIYGMSKWASEIAVSAFLDKWLVVRTSGLYGISRERKGAYNFVLYVMETAKRVGEVNLVTDHTLSPTYTFDLAKKIVDAIDEGVEGFLHLANEGSITWYEFGKKILDILNLPCKLVPVRWEDLKRKAKRPKYSALSTTLSRYKLPSLDDALRRFMEKII